MKKLPNKLPSISRRLTENVVLSSILKKWQNFKKTSQVKKGVLITSTILTLILIIILASLTIFLTFRFSQNLEAYTTISTKREDIYGKINFWKSIAQKYDGYSEAYFNIAILYYQLRSFGESRTFLDMALKYSPNEKQALDLDKKLKQLGY